MIIENYFRIKYKQKFFSSDSFCSVFKKTLVF